MPAHTPFARYTPVDHSKVSFTGGFWQSWIETVRNVTVPSLHRRLEEEGFLEVLNFHKPRASLVRPIQPSGLSMQHFFDSDFGKWIEAASYTLKAHPDPGIERRIDDIVDRLAEGQLPDGYLNSWFIRREPDERWTNLRDLHEMYSMGHLLEGAVAYFEATGKRRFLDIMIRAVDHIIEVFRTEPGQLRGYDAHEEIELALVKLYRVTRDRRYLDLALYLVNERGRRPHYYDEEARRRGEDPRDYVYKDYSYSQAHIPVREQTQVVGHAVRAMYLYSAMTDLAAETGDRTLLDACHRLFDNLTGRQLYVTGGIGRAHANEGFTREYDLPNATAYAETCAAIGLGFWAHRMAQLELDGRFGDHLELVLFNGSLSGLSRDGERYFYDNVLESHGENRRWKWHYCPCCATNIARLIASLGSYFYTTRPEELAIHLYGANVADLSVAGTNVKVEQVTDYPSNGDITIRVSPSSPKRFAIRLRIPGWCRNATIRLGGKEISPDIDKGYATITREWREGDELTLNFEMSIERLRAHPEVADDIERVALRRGPVVYCVEQADNRGSPLSLRLPADAPLTSSYHPELLGGAVTIEGPALIPDAADWGAELYRPARPTLTVTPFRAIPYHLWANREPGAMAVWLHEVHMP